MSGHGDITPGTTLWLGGRGMIPLVRATHVVKFYGPRSYGTISGVVGFFTAIAQALAPGGVGLLFDHWHGYREVIWLLVAAGAVATISAFSAERLAPRRSEEQVA